MFFKKMTESEHMNAKKGFVFGFFVYAIITAINYFYYVFTESSLLSPVYTFWSGLSAAFLFGWIGKLRSSSADSVQ